MLSVNWVDGLIIIFFFLSILGGFYRGFIREIIALIAIIAAFVIAAMFTTPLANFFSGTSAVQNVINQSSEASQSASYVVYGLSYAVLFFGTIILGSIIGYFLNAVFGVGILGVGNRILGGVFGFVRALALTIVIIFILQFTTTSDSQAWKKSFLIKASQPAIQWIEQLVTPHLTNLQDKLSEPLQSLSAKFKDISDNYLR